MGETSSSRKSDAQEPSMEDILASIRRILAEDGSAAAPDTLSDEAGFTSSAEKSAGEHAAELTLRAAEPSSIDDADAEPNVTGDTPQVAEEDVFMLAPEMRARTHSLVSPQAADNSTDVLSQLARAILDRRDIAVGSREVTLESMIREMLRPMLREWLDRNLPYLIERLVKKEIDLMINRAERLED